MWQAMARIPSVGRSIDRWVRRAAHTRRRDHRIAEKKSVKGGRYSALYTPCRYQNVETINEVHCMHHQWKGKGIQRRSVVVGSLVVRTMLIIRRLLSLFCCSIRIDGGYAQDFLIKFVRCPSPPPPYTIDPPPPPMVVGRPEDSWPRPKQEPHICHTSVRAKGM